MLELPPHLDLTAPGLFFQIPPTDHLLHREREIRSIRFKAHSKTFLRAKIGAHLRPDPSVEKLNITKERTVTVDYFVLVKRPLAVQLIKKKSDVSGTMEKWGFRWDELEKAYSGLAPVMLYDRNTQAIDAYSRHIGESKCELFCGYDETDRIHDTLESIR